MRILRREDFYGKIYCIRSLITDETFRITKRNEIETRS